MEKISYSFILLHPLALWSANWVTVELLKQFDSTARQPVLLTAFAFSVAAITPLVYASWRFVECRPLNRRPSRPSRSMTARSSFRDV